MVILFSTQSALLTDDEIFAFVRGMSACTIGHVIMIDTEGGCDRLSDAIWLVRCLFSNVRPRLSLSSMLFHSANLSLIVIPIGYLRIGRRISGRFVDGIRSPTRILCLISPRTAPIFKMKIKRKKFGCINFSTTAARVWFACLNRNLH
ncbi:Bifunctional purine biosynthesis protein PurH [Trichinella pseudospiralis]